MKNPLWHNSWQELEKHFLRNLSDIFFQDDDIQLTKADFLERVNQRADNFKVTQTNRIIALELNLVATLDELITIFALLKNNHLIVPHSEKEKGSLKNDLNLLLALQSDFKQQMSGIFFKTSGTSGSPKFFFFPISKILSLAFIQGKSLEIVHGELIGLNLPLFHVSGFMQVVRAIVHDATIYKKDDLLFRANHISLVPTQAIRFFNAGKLSMARGKQVLLIGGSYLDKELSRKLELGNFLVRESYGATETLGFFSLNGSVLNNYQIQVDNFSSPILYCNDLPDFYIQNGIVTHTNHQKNGITLKDHVELTQNSGKTEIKFIARNDVIFKIAGENINPLLIEKNIFSDLNLSHKFFFALDILYLPYPDYEYQNIPVILVITNGQSSTETNGKITKAIINYFSNNSPYKSLWQPKKILFLNSAIHFEQKIGRNFYINYVANSIGYTVFNQFNVDLVSMHGFLGHLYEFSQILEMASLNKTVLALGLPLKDELDLFEFRNHLSYFFHLKRLLKKLIVNNPQISILGYSMGGRILLRALLEIFEECPNELQGAKVKLILLSVSFGLNNEDEKLKRLEHDQNLLKTFQSKEEFLDFWYTQSLFGPKELLDKRLSHDPEFIERIEFNQNALEKILSLFSPGTFPTHQETIDLLKKHKAFYSNHIELIVGACDQKYLQVYQNTKKDCPDLLNLHIVKDAYHDPHRTNPIEIADLLKNIFKIN